MKWLRFALAAVLVLGAALPDVASADRGRIGRHRSHSSLGVHIGIPLFWGWPGPYYGYSPYRYYEPYPYYGYPSYYAYPPAVTVPSSPPVYIERDDADDDRKSAGNYWYYCDRPEGYYPYVKECPGGWERVAPRPSR
ncbi:hypothetical protein AZOA_15640 [Azoarcus sp. Aa7]|nr:hypothetical protein [Azoarcus sp. Aa7]